MVKVITAVIRYHDNISNKYITTRIYIIYQNICYYYNF